MTAPPPDVGSQSARQTVEEAINNALPNVDDLPARSEFDITETEAQQAISSILSTSANAEAILNIQQSRKSSLLSTIFCDEFAKSSQAATVAVDSADIMEAISSSPVARASISTNTTAYNTISEDNMALGKYVAGLAGLIPQNYTTIDDVTSDNPSMDSVLAEQIAVDALLSSEVGITSVSNNPATALSSITGSPSAMDVLSNSQTAKDTIGAEGSAFSEIASNNMSIGKYAAGLSGLEPSDYADYSAVLSDSTAFSTLLGSSLGIEASVRSPVAFSLLLASPSSDDVWSEDTPSSTVWASGEPSVPTSGGVSGLSIDYNTVPGRLSGTGQALELSGSGANNQKAGPAGWTFTVDLSDYQTFEVYTQEVSTSGTIMAIVIGTEKVFKSSGSSGWTQRSFDVSSKSGPTDILLALTDDSLSTTAGVYQFDDLALN